MRGTIAITDYDWYRRLSSEPVEEVNFWKPSSTRAFYAEEFSPFIFKLRAPHNAICGFGFFARYSRLPDWLAWETFGVGNGCASLEEMRTRIYGIRQRIRFRGLAPSEIGCILIVNPVFFPPERWVAPPKDWPPRTQAEKKYDISEGEGARVWADCLASVAVPTDAKVNDRVQRSPASQRYGEPVLVVPRLGQGTFRIGVTDAYARGCAVTGEHSLPALDAAHIKPYRMDGPHEIANGLLLRADLHRLFDKGYITITPNLKIEVSERLRQDFANGHSYYPWHGREISCPANRREWPEETYLQWHNENVYLG
jgi:putative restriction endonuclease